MPNGAPRELTDKTRDLVDGWDDPKADKALQPKLALLHTHTQKRSAASQIATSWGKACRVLFEEYHAWVCKIRDEKYRLVDEFMERQEEQQDGAAETQTDNSERSIARSVDESVPATPSGPATPSASEESSSAHHESIFAPLLKQSANHYDDVLHFFDKAIKELGGVNPEPERVRRISIVPEGVANGKRRLSFAREPLAKSSKLEGGRSSRADPSA